MSWFWWWTFFNEAKQILGVMSPKTLKIITAWSLSYHSIWRTCIIQFNYIGIDIRNGIRDIFMIYIIDIGIIWNTVFGSIPINIEVYREKPSTLNHLYMVDDIFLLATIFYYYLYTLHRLDRLTSKTFST